MARGFGSGGFSNRGGSSRGSYGTRGSTGGTVPTLALVPVRPGIALGEVLPSQRDK